jgi:hypothetical protein
MVAFNLPSVSLLLYRPIHGMHRTRDVVRSFEVCDAYAGTLVYDYNNGKLITISRAVRSIRSTCGHSDTNRHYARNGATVLVCMHAATCCWHFNGNGKSVRYFQEHNASLPAAALQ